MEREFKYYPDDFAELPVTVKHMDLSFDMYDEKTIVTSTIEVITKEPLTSLTLNAKNLEINTVLVKDYNTTFEYKKEKDILLISFEKKVEKETQLFITTNTTCYPTEHVLEGIYKDTTPKGCKCQFITQCQQWGFQRIVPCFDDMSAKCTYTTKITADVSYTHLLSNGNISKEREDNENTKRAVIHYENTKTPMATYLFFLGAGTYAGFRRELEYANGKTFLLELLVPPNSKKEEAEKALDILHDGIQWINIYTGPSSEEHKDKKNVIWELLKKRNTTTNTIEKERLRKELRSLSEFISGYEYTGEIYREIGMQKSNFGGMENVGNTTVLTNRIMPFSDMTDRAFEYMFRVKTHEFYHNLNGSEVTGKTPFEIWLNEAATVHIEREWHEFLFGHDYARLDEVQSIIAPQNGVMEQDLSKKSMPIEPDGFNDPDELITHITYQKAPEVVRMVQTLLSKDTFNKALHSYHTKFKHSNASRDDWFHEMEVLSGLNLRRFAKVWLKQTGFPTIHVKTMYLPETNQFEVNIKQSVSEKNEHFEFPFEIALCDEKGNIISTKTPFIQKNEETIIFEDSIEEPAYISLNRGFSVYGKVIYEQETTEQLYLQAKTESDIVNRFIAIRKLLDEEKLAVLEKKRESFSKEFIALFKELLTNEDLISSVGGLLLGISQSIDNDLYRFKFQELYTMAKSLRRSVAKELFPELKDIYLKRKEAVFEGDYVEKSVAELKNRQVKNFCLSLLAELDTQETRDLCKEQFLESTNITDKWVGAQLYLMSSAEDRLEFLHSLYSFAKENLVRWETFIGVIGGLDVDDSLAFIKEVISSKDFDLSSPNDQHIYMYFANNKRLSLLKKEGREFIKNAICTLAPINEYQTNHIVDVFNAIDRFDTDVKNDAITLLKEVIVELDEVKQPSVVKTIKRLLKEK